MTTLGLHRGAQVTAVRPNSTLRERHGVVEGVTVGTIMSFDTPSHQDGESASGMVDWGDGSPIRCRADELRVVNPARMQVYRRVDDLVLGGYDYTATRDPSWHPYCVTSAAFVTVAAGALARGFDITHVGLGLSTCLTDKERDATQAVLCHLLNQGKGEAAGALMRELSVKIAELSVRGDEGAASLHRNGLYTSTSDAAFIGLIRPLLCPQKQARRRWWRSR